MTTKVLYLRLKDVNNINIVKSGGATYESYELIDDEESLLYGETYFYAELTDEQCISLLFGHGNSKFSYSNRNDVIDYRKIADLELEFRLYQIGTEVGKFVSLNNSASLRTSDVAKYVAQAQEKALTGISRVLTFVETGKSRKYTIYSIAYNNKSDELTILESINGEYIVNILEDLDDPCFSALDIEIAMTRLLEILVEKSEGC